MSLKLRVERCLDVTVMELTGRLTLGVGASSYRDAIRDAIWNGHRKLAIDYGDIDYQDSSGTGELVSGFTLMANAGGELVIFDMTQRLKDLFQMTKLYTVFRVFDSRESALAYFDSTRKREIQVSQNRYHHVAVLGIEGSVKEEFGSIQIVSAVQSTLKAGAQSVILLCPQIIAIDQSGAKHLFAARQEVETRGAQLALAGVEERLLTAMSEVGIAGEFRIYKTVDEAIRAFGLTRDRWKVEVAGAR